MLLVVGVQAAGHLVPVGLGLRLGFGGHFGAADLGLALHGVTALGRFGQHHGGLLPAFPLQLGADGGLPLAEQTDVLDIVAAGLLGCIEDAAQLQRCFGDGTGRVDGHFLLLQRSFGLGQLLFDYPQLLALDDQHLQKIGPGQLSQVFFIHSNNLAGRE